MAIGTKPVDTKPVDAKPVDAKPVDAKPMVAKPVVLCVDDEPEVLQANAMLLRRKYEVLTANSGIAALELLKTKTPAVIISDMRMPGMDGATLLARVHEIMPSMSRILLTGQADTKAAAAAVNQGRIFRFLMKPCGVDELLEAIAAGVEQHRVIGAEQVLLDQTLRGAVRALGHLLALIDPSGARIGPVIPISTEASASNWPSICR